jgi:predicted helicase
MGSVHEVIEAFREAPSNSERGTKFEKLMVRNFELDPMLSQQYAAVRRSIREQGGEPLPRRVDELLDERVCAGSANSARRTSTRTC